MEYDRTYSIYFWVDHIATPRWQKRQHATEGCYICQKNITKASPHCHLCGVLVCRDCTTYRHLPSRFNLKRRPQPAPLSVCIGCVEQVQTRRLAVLSELSRIDKQSLSDYVDLPVLSSTRDEKSPSETGGNTDYRVSHIFIGIRKAFTIRQLYNILIHNKTISHMHHIIFTYNNQLVNTDQLDTLTANALLPLIYLATKAQCLDPTNKDYPTPLTKPHRGEKQDQRQQKQDQQQQSYKPVAPPNAVPILVFGESTATSSKEAKSQHHREPSSSSPSPHPQPQQPRQDAHAAAAAAPDEHSKKKKGVWVVAMHSYLNTKPGKIISFAKGDRLRVINKKSDDWWFAVTEHGEAKGWIPAQYVQEIPL